LAFDVGLFASKISKTDRINVNIVDCCENTDEGTTSVCAGSDTKGGSGFGVSCDHTVDKIHGVEGCLVDRNVIAKSNDRWHRNGCVAECSDDPNLTTHVVGSSEHVPKWRSAENPTPPTCVAHVVSEVGETSGDELELKRFDECRHAFKHPLGDICSVNACNVA
jgi:hypothetical protein